MKRMTVWVFSVFFLLLLPTALFAGDRYHRRHSPRYSRYNYNPHYRSYHPRRIVHHRLGTVITIEVGGGVYYEPYYPDRHYGEVHHYYGNLPLCDLVDGLTFGLLDVCGRKAAIATTERLGLEQIRAGVVTGTMGKEGAVLYSSPNGPTELRASRDPTFGTSVTATDSSVATSRLPLPSVDLRALRSVSKHMESAGADDAEFSALGRAIEEIGDRRRPAYFPDQLRQDVVVLRHLLRKLERSGAPAAVVAALADAIEYLDRASS